MAELASSKGMSQSSFDRRRNDLHMNDREWLEITDRNANVPNTLWKWGEWGKKDVRAPHWLGSSTSPLWGSGKMEEESMRGSREISPHNAFPIMCLLPQILTMNQLESHAPPFCSQGVGFLSGLTMLRWLLKLSFPEQTTSQNWAGKKDFERTNRKGEVGFTGLLLAGPTNQYIWFPFLVY